MCSMKITDVNQPSLIKREDNKIMNKNMQLSSNENSSKVNDLKQKIAAGDYQIDFNKLAEKIAQRLITDKE